MVGEGLRRKFKVWNDARNIAKWYDTNWPKLEQIVIRGLNDIKQGIEDIINGIQQGNIQDYRQIEGRLNSLYNNNKSFLEVHSNANELGGVGKVPSVTAALGVIAGIIAEAYRHNVKVEDLERRYSTAHNNIRSKVDEVIETLKNLCRTVANKYDPQMANNLINKEYLENIISGVNIPQNYDEYLNAISQYDLVKKIIKIDGILRALQRYIEEAKKITVEPISSKYGQYIPDTSRLLPEIITDQARGLYY